MKKLNKLLLATVISFSTWPAAFAQTPDDRQINIGVILDGRYQDGVRNFSEFDDGFSLGHTELTLFGNIDDKFRGVLTPVLEVADDETELDIEEAFIEAVGLVPGLNIRAGRFFSEFGHLNSRHLHEDDFSDRPAVYRTYLGDHFFDDGIAADFVAPTDNFISVTLEAFSGEDFAASDTPDSQIDTINIIGASVNFGGDSGPSTSWKLGLSVLHNDNGMVTASSLEAHEEEEGSEEEDDEHGHGAAITGEKLYGLDYTWKWAPNGNFKDKNLTLNAEYIRLDGLFDSVVGSAEGAPDSLNGWYLSAAYQFSPKWTLGLRYGEVEIYEGDVHFDDGELEGEYDLEKISEMDLSLAWHPSHFSSVRATYTRETLDGHDGSEDENIFVLQYVMSLGAHRSHSF